MSVTIVTAEEIAAIVGSFVRLAIGEIPLGNRDLVSVAATLARTNAESVAHYYHSRQEPVQVTSGMISAARLAPLRPAALADALRRYRNQSCDHPAWDGSRVATAIDEMIRLVETAPAVREDAAARAREEAETLRRRQEGARYRETKEETTPQIAARIRSDIKAAVKAGTLPGATYSVRTRSYAGGSSIDVGIDALPFCTWELREEPGRLRTVWRVVATAEADAVKTTIEGFVGAYNFNRSDSMTDYSNVRFYGHVNLDDSEEREGLYAHADELNRGVIDRIAAVAS